MLTGSLALATGAVAHAQEGEYGPGYGMGPGMMGGYGPGYGRGPGAGGGYGYGPGYGAGPGMMGGYGGWGMGPGMMGGHGGWGMGPGMMGGHGSWGMGPGMMGGYGAGPGMLYQLNLTPEQWDKIGAIQEAQAKKHWETAGKMRDEAFKLRRLMFSEKRDRGAILAQYRKVQELRQQRFQERLDTLEKIDAVLTKEQKAQRRRFGAW